MKRFIAAVLAAAMTAGAAGSYAVTAADAKNTDHDIVIFGDSIAAGYGLDTKTEYNYGQICADYLGGTVANYAVSGDTTDDMLKVIGSLDASQKQALKNAEYVVISIGGNDLIHYAAKYVLNYAAENNLLVSGKTAADIPAEPTASHLLTLLDRSKLSAYASSTNNAADLLVTLKKLCNNLMVKNESYEGVIPEKVIPNIKTAVKNIKAINPNARIIVQTIYQPIQFDNEYLAANYGSNASTYVKLFGQLRSNFEKVLQLYAKELGGIDGIEIADVNHEFTSLKEGEAQNNDNPGHAAYFVNIQESGSKRDIHPNQKGHLAIASTILNTIGELHDDSGLLSGIFKSLTDTSAYPLIAVDTYKKAAGNLMLGDVNFDEKIDARDASRVLKNYTYIADDPNSAILSEIQLKQSDVNGDTLSDAKDASALLRFYAYLSNNEYCPIDEFLKSGK